MGKKNKLAALFLSALLCAGLFAGCGLKGNGSSSSNPTSPAPSSSEPGSAASQSSQGGESSSSSAPSSLPAGSDVSDAGGMVTDITTGNAAFDAKFKENPIDKDYEEANENAGSTQAMAQASMEFAAAWRVEGNEAYQKLIEKAGADTSKYKAEQKKWESGKDDAVQKIRDDAAAAGGSMAAVTAANGEMEFYRAHAAELYQALYRYDPEFTFSYTGEAVG